MNLENIVIIGSGPAGHTAAIYAARANLSPVMYEGFIAGGIAAGGQLTTTTEVENFPGFPDGIDGTELMNLLRRQSVKYGTKIMTQTISKVDFSCYPFQLQAEKEIFSRSVIIATGATAKRMQVKGEEKLWQKGISACAVCDGALPIFRNQKLAVIGGGDSAIEEATYLSKFASKIYLIHRRDRFRASQIMQQRAFHNPKIKILWNETLQEVFGQENLEKILLQNTITKKTSFLEVKGLFYAIGHKPNTEIFEPYLHLDKDKYIVTQKENTKTNIEGIFACGDVQDKVYRQAVTSAGTGCMAALDVEKWLEQNY